MRLQDIRNNRRPLEIDFGDGDVLALVYQPNVITGRFRSEHQTVPAFLAGCVAEWDLIDGEEPVPLDAEAIEDQVPEPVRVAIYRAIFEDIHVPKAK
jgi:hypothetical protein